MLLFKWDVTLDTHFTFIYYEIISHLLTIFICFIVHLIFILVK